MLRVLAGRRVSWRTVGVLCVGILAASGVFTPVTASTSPIPYGEAEQTAVRLDGADRYGVAVSISGELSRPGRIEVVYLVSGSAYADAVAAGPAAAQSHAPILYTGKDSLPEAVAAELARLHPSRVEVVGDSSVIGDGVFGTVTEMLGQASIVERVSGRTSWDLAAVLSAADFAPGVDTVVVASAENFFDALVAGPAAVALGAPLLLVTAGSLPGATENELRRLSPHHVVVVGDSRSISANVIAAIQAICPAVEQVSGGDRYATAAAVAARFFAAGAAVVATSGVDEVGGLAAVPLAASHGASIVLTQSGDQLPNATRDCARAHINSSARWAQPISRMQ